MPKSLVSFVLLFICTVIILFWQNLGVEFLRALSQIYSFGMHAMQNLILDHLFRQILIVLVVSLLLGLIPVFIYWVVRRRWYYGYMPMVWCIWVVLMTMIIVRVGSQS